MMLLLWLLLVMAGTCLFLVIVSSFAWETYRGHSGTRAVICPGNGQPVTVELDAWRAAFTGLGGARSERIAACTRWPRRLQGDCAQACIGDALAAVPCTAGEVLPAPDKRIYHLPVLVAAFTAWYLGAVWHSQFVFRTAWLGSLEMSASDLRPVLWLRAAHLLTAGVCLLFAYGVAWLLAWQRRFDARHGMATAALLWMALALASVTATGWAGVPRTVLQIEAGYTLLASVVTGAVIGSLHGKLRIEALDRGGRLDPPITKGGQR